MPDQDRRCATRALAELEQLIDRMERLGQDAEDAAERVTKALGGTLGQGRNSDQQQLVAAIGDVIEIVTERSKLAHEAHRMIVALRREDSDRWLHSQQ